MKNNKFWIITGALFLIWAVLYFIFVSSERDKVKREENNKKSSIAKLESLKGDASAGKIPSNKARESVSAAVRVVEGHITDLNSFIGESQKEFLYIKGDSEWKYKPDEVLQYKGWYNKKRDELYDALKRAGFFFEVEGKATLEPSDEDRIKESLGFKFWSSETPALKDLVEAQQQLAFIEIVFKALGDAFQDKKNMYPVLQKIAFESWMELDFPNGVNKSKASIKIDCPFTMINIVISELEKSKLRLKVDGVEISKKGNSKDYSEFPNIALTLNVSFQVIVNRKAP